nr:ISL3 family transposase [Gordonia bronchialis]
MSSVVQKVLTIDAIVEDVTLEETTVDPDGMVVVSVRAYARDRSRCGECGRRCPGYDQVSARRRWRHLDVAGRRCVLAASLRRVRCTVHGVVTEAVPWARPRARFTRAFDDMAAWLAAHATVSAVTQFLRVALRTVSGIVERVVDDHFAGIDRLDGLVNVGIDEIAYRKGHRYLTVVINHDTGLIVWAKEGRDSAVLGEFFDALGAERAAMIEKVSADGAEWIWSAVTTRAPHAIQCLDVFHLIQWAGAMVDKVRRRTVATHGGGKGAMWAVRKSHGDQSPEQRGIVEQLRADNSDLYEAYMLKEQLREAIRSKGRRRLVLLTGVQAWARASDIPEIAALGRTLDLYNTRIRNALRHNISNARSEATNTHLRALTKRAYGFHTPEALIAMAELTRGGACPELPWS